MPTIRKRNGRYQVQVRIHGTAPQSRTFTRRADAEAWAKEAEVAVERGAFGDRRRLKAAFSEILKRYLAEITPKKRGADREEVRINRLLRDPISRLSLANLSPQVLAEFRDRRLVDGPRACSYDIAIISHVLNIARKEWGYPMMQNPISMIVKPPNSRPRDRRLRLGEYERLETAAKRGKVTYLWPAVNLAIETGMRVGELLSLTWGQVDLRKGTAYLPLTKNGSARVVPLSPPAVRWVLELPKNEGRLIPATFVALRQTWYRLLRRAKIDDLHFHDLRHEAITRFFELGLSIPEVALISGHKDPRMLFRYTHLRAEDVGAKLAASFHRVE